jgi:hypothetical protein
MPETDQHVDVVPEAAAPEEEIEIKNEDGTVNWQQAARKWEREARKNAAAVREVEKLRPKAQQFDALEAASKTDLERAQAQADALQQELVTTQHQALVASVALETRLPPSLARRLQGDTREELLADAEDLLAQFPQQSNEPRAPRVDLSQGSSGKGAVSTDPAQQFASIIRGQLGS